MGVTILSPSIAIDRHLLAAAGKDLSSSFAIDQKDVVSIEKTFHYRLPSIETLPVSCLMSVTMSLEAIVLIS